MTKRIITAVVIAIALALMGTVYWGYQKKSIYKYARNTIAYSMVSTLIQQQNTELTATSTSPENDHVGMKLYRNNQWGFEFWYPKGWVWQENVFGGPRIKFNLTVMKIDGIMGSGAINCNHENSHAQVTILC